MIPFSEDLDAFIDNSLTADYLQQLQKIHEAASLVADTNVAGLYADGSTFNETEVWKNQYNGFIRKLGKCVIDKEYV